MLDELSRHDIRDGLSPEERMDRVASIWCKIDVENPGAIDEVALDELRFEVTEAMVKGDAGLAESRTFLALLLIPNFK